MDGSDGPQTPAERVLPSQLHPTKWETYEANKTLDDSFLKQFKERLLQSEDARTCDAMPLQGHEQLPWPLVSKKCEESEYTYPLWVIDSSDESNIDVEEELRRLRPSFPTSLKNYIYLDRLDLEDLWHHNHIPPPYLEAALACLTCIMSNGYDKSNSKSLFMVGVRLFIVILEMDNREARKLEGAIALQGLLLTTYGLLTAETSSWRVATNMLTFSMTVMRRLTPSPTLPTGNSSVAKTASYNTLICFNFLIDTLSAVHFGRLPGFSTAELNISMPTGDHGFQTVYNSLFDTESPVPNDVRSSEDGVLLLSAILSDTLFSQRSTGSIIVTRAVGGNMASSMSSPTNPFATLTPMRESLQRRNSLKNALDRWLQHFDEGNLNNILALYYFCRLCLSCPDLRLLPSMAKYPPGTSVSTGSRKKETPNGELVLDISEEALQAAWKVLDHVDVRLPRDKQCLWLPIILFFSALVVWYKAKESSAGSTSSGYTSLKTLAAFSQELEKLPWSCCTTMSATLERLMRAGK